MDDLIARLTEDHPGYENLISQVTSLVTTYPPPFIYINDPTTPRIASSILRSILLGCSKLPLSASPEIRFAHVDVVACFTARVFYDTVLNAMAQWPVRWEDGCENWSDDESGKIWNDSVDAFMHGLKAVYAAMGKGTSRMVLAVDKAERLKETLPDLVVPLTRLAELVSLPISPSFRCPA